MAVALSEPGTLPVLVTGAGGFVGRAAVRALTAAGRPVLTLGRSAAALPPGVPGVVADLSRPDDLPVLPRLGAVLHFAYASDLRGRADSAAIVAVDTAMTRSALALAGRDDAHFVLASTASLYGTADRPLSEDDPLNTADDLDGYLAAKLACERLAADLEGAPRRRLVLRMVFPYGPGVRQGTLFDRLLWPERAVRPVRLDGRDGIATNPIHIDDLGEAVVRLLAVEATGAVNLAGPETATLRAIGDRAASLCGTVARYEEVPAHRPPLLTAAIGRLERLTGWRPPTGIEDGLRRTYAALHQPTIRG